MARHFRRTLLHGKIILDGYDDDGNYFVLEPAFSRKFAL